MKTLPSQQEAGAIFEQPKGEFSVLVIYEDFIAGLRAKRILDRLADQIGLGSEESARWWRLDLLGQQEFRNAAAKQATVADLVLFAAHGHPKTIQDFESWAGEWASQRTNPGALVVSLSDSVREAVASDGTLHDLGQLSHHAGMRLFPHFGDLSGPPPSDESTPPAPDLHPFASGGLHENPYLRGGINE